MYFKQKSDLLDEDGLGCHRRVGVCTDWLLG